MRGKVKYLMAGLFGVLVALLGTESLADDLTIRSTPFFWDDYFQLAWVPLAWGAFLVSIGFAILSLSVRKFNRLAQSCK